MNILNLDLHNLKLLPLNGGGVFRKVLMLKKVLEVIFLMRRLVFKQKLGYDATCWTCDLKHKRMGVNCRGFNLDDLKINHLRAFRRLCS